MKRCALIFVAVFLSAAPGRASWAEAMFSELTHDYGALSRSSVGMHQFAVKNTTGQPVHVASIRVSCGCVTASMAKADLAPGEETVLVARIEPRRFNGVIHKTIFVLFDRPETAEVRLAVQANCRDDLIVTPETAAFGQVARGSEPANKVTLSIFGHGRIQVLKAASDSGFIEPKVSAAPGNGTDATFELTVKLRRDLPAGNWSSMVWLTTNDAGLPRIGIPVTVDVTEPRVASPGRVSAVGSR